MKYRLKMSKDGYRSFESAKLYLFDTVLYLMEAIMLASMDRLIDPRAILNFYMEFKDKPSEVAKQKAYEYGIEFGRGLAQQLEIKDDDIEALATIFRLTHRNEPTANIEVSEKKIEGEKRGLLPDDACRLVSKYTLGMVVWKCWMAFLRRSRSSHCARC